jgi:hypothetical protein
MENKQKTWKLVLQDYHNDDQYLLGFYPSETDAKLAIPFVKQRYKEWIGNREPIIKRVNPEMILNPVCTDYMHYVRSLIPDKEMKRVMDSDASAEICTDDLMCGGATYYYLSRMIPKDWYVIDIGASYGAQSYLFQDHAKYIAVEPSESSDEWNFEYFKADGTERYEMTARKFIKDILPTLNLDMKKTFAICNYVPAWYGENPMELVRETFHNCYVYYPQK